MLLARYFLSVGGILLALLFVADAIAPKVPVAATDRNDVAVDKSVIRIHSDRKWPEPVVFDTNVPTIVPAQTVKAEAVAAPPTPAADLSAARVRETFAQFVPAEPKKPQRKRKIARNRVAPPMVVVAQQPRFGFFNTW
jgi:hypothetical protein